MQWIYKLRALSPYLLFYNDIIVLHELTLTDQLKFNHWRNSAFSAVCIPTGRSIKLRFQLSVLIGQLYIQVIIKPCFHLWCKQKQHTDSVAFWALIWILLLERKAAINKVPHMPTLPHNPEVSRSPNLPDKSDFKPLHHCKLTSCVQMYFNENNLVFFKLISPFLEAFFRLSNLLITKPHVEGN